MITLRPYQQKFISDVRNKFAAGFKRVCGVAPCGAGKTIITGWMVRESLQRGKRSIFFVHRKELIEQTAKAFNSLGIPFGVICAGYDFKSSLPVQIASVQTLSRRIDKIPTPDFLICDECHHILSNTYKKIIDKWQDAYLLGVTATPQRIGGINLGDVFDTMVLAPSVKELIELGNLTNFAYYAPESSVNFKGLRSHFGDYDIKDLEKMMTDNQLISGVVDKYKIYANNKSCICYCVNVNHSKLVASALTAAGIPAAHCDGETPPEQRKSIVKAFRAGYIKVLCNAELFGEGFDVPNMDAVILARPTKSLTLHIQQSMRPMRPDPNNPDKVATIIDYVKNFENLGLPDTPHKWSLAPKEKSKDEGNAPFKTCPNCSKVIAAGSRSCPKCGYKFPLEDNISADVGDLKQIIKINFEHFQKIAKERNYKPGWAVFRALETVSTIEEVKQIEKLMGYKRGWAKHQWERITQERCAN